MGLHHVALATRDIEATHAFYSDLLGFKLVKVVTGATEGGGWSKHIFYDTGGDGLIAFWDIHDESLGEFRTDISTGFGLPVHVNHLAFSAGTLDDLTARRKQWQERGITVAEIDHGFCTSIYTTDPNGIIVEFCCDTCPLNEEDAAEAERLLHDPNPPIEDEPKVTIHRAVSANA